MKYQLLLLLTLALLSCGQKKDNKEIAMPKEPKATIIDSLKNYSISIVTEDDFLNAKNNYKDLTLYDTVINRKINGKIKLPVKDKKQKFVVFKDTLVETDNEGIRQYVYVGQFDKIGLYIVGGSFWEHFECYLVNKTTGKQTTIWNDPMTSPNDKYIANLSMQYGLEGVPNGLQVWKTINDGEKGFDIQKHFEIDQQIWAPEDFAWETDDTLILKVFPVDKYWSRNGQMETNDYYYLRIRIE